MTRRATAIPVGCDTGECVTIIVTVSLYDSPYSAGSSSSRANWLPPSAAGPCRAGAQVKAVNGAKPAEPSLDLLIQVGQGQV